jgi:pyridoxal phosphate enzyme (YggS family)
LSSDIVYNINQVRQKIEKAARNSGRTSSDIKLLAVTKTVDYDAAVQCFEAGVTDLAENRVQELTRKFPHIPQAQWHLIGRLQTNKVKDMVGKVCLIHSLDRWRLAEEINKRYLQARLIVPVLIQVNVSGETQKAGIAPADMGELLDSIGQLSNIQVKGLMTIAPEVQNVEETRPVFRELFRLRNMAAAKDYTNVELRFLSMGMSQDFEVAIEEGSNMVRIGSAIFKSTPNLH